MSWRAVAGAGQERLLWPLGPDPGSLAPSPLPAPGGFLHAVGSSGLSLLCYHCLLFSQGTMSPLEGSDPPLSLSYDFTSSGP